jgi:uncharacterized protein YjbJ (UPF0337 family)
MAEALKGDAKKRAGGVTGSRRLRAERRADQVKGNLKQACVVPSHCRGR